MPQTGQAALRKVNRSKDPQAMDTLSSSVLGKGQRAGGRCVSFQYRLITICLKNRSAFNTTESLPTAQQNVPSSRRIIAYKPPGFDRYRFQYTRAFATGFITLKNVAVLNHDSFSACRQSSRTERRTTQTPPPSLRRTQGRGERLSGSRLRSLHGFFPFLRWRAARRAQTCMSCSSSKFERGALGQLVKIFQIRYHCIAAFTTSSRS